MKTPFLIDWFDFYGKDIPLQIFGSPKKKGLFGALMGVLSLLSIGVITIYFLITLFQRDTKQIITNKSTTLIPINDLTLMPFLISLVDPNGNPVPLNAGIYEAYAITVKVKWANGNYLGTEVTPFELQPCTREDAAGFPFPDSTLAWNWCVPFGKYNLTLNGYENDLTRGWSSMYFYLTKCNPHHNKNCKNATVINNVMEQAYFTVATGIGIVDNDDNTNPMKLTSQAHQVGTSISLYKSMTVNYIQNMYTDDYGFVFESLVTHNFFTIGEVITTYSLNAPRNYPYLGGSELISTIVIQNSQNVVTTKRTFLKAQAILANIGGVIKFIMVIAQVITQFVTRKNVFIQIGNEVFDYRESKEWNLKEIEKSENKILKIERKVENAVPNFLSTPHRDEYAIGPIENKSFNLRKKIGPSFNQQSNNESRIPLKLTIYQLLCITFCVKNKRVMNQYDVTESTILEKVSIHSIIRDSYQLENLSKLTLNPDQYRTLKETTHFPLEILFN